MAFAQTDFAPARCRPAARSNVRLFSQRAIVATAAGGLAMAFVAQGVPLPRRASETAPATVDLPSRPVHRGDTGLEWTLADARLPAATQLPPQLAVSALPLPFHFQGSDLDRGKAVDCLAAAGWYEAGNDPVGQRSVMQVVLNRVEHPSFPKSVCGVVFQGSERTTGCQFSFTCDGSMQRRVPSPAAWSRSRALAQQALSGKIDKAVFQATHYHADYVVPWWSAKLNKLTQIGAHIFYSWPGERGVIGRWHTFAPERDIAALQGMPGNAAIGKTGIAPQSADSGLVMPTTPAPKYSFSQETAMSAAPPADETMLLQVDAASPSGRWALQALKTCTGRTSCTVIGYENAMQLDLNRKLAPADRERPLFLFVRDAASGMDRPLWDCNRIERPDAAQCLPANGPALRNLLRNR